MRVGDSYKIKRMATNGNSDKEIAFRFRNDYPEDEVASFIKAARLEIKADVKAEAAKKKSDPLG